MGIKKLFGQQQANQTEFTTVPGKASKTLGEILRITGKHSFELPERELDKIKALFERWADHIVSGKSPDEKPDSALRRWDDLIAIYAEHRGLEEEFVKQGMGDLRLLFWKLVRSMAANLSQDRVSDATVSERLDRLKGALASQSVEQLRREAEDTVRVIDELAAKRQSRHRDQLRELGKQLRQMRIELDAARRQLVVDPLTRLYNRKALDEHIVRIADLSIFSGKPACLMMIDIDHFKRINDTYGHPVGDAILRDTAKLFIDNFPRKTDFVARYGGEEFAIILQEDGIDVAKTLAERLLKKIASTRFRHDDVQLQATVSIGLAELIAGETADRWIARADAALYEAKHAGRNCVRRA